MGKIALCNINCVDVETGTFVRNQTIEISGERIVKIYNTHQHTPDDCDNIYDYSDCWAIPGLIDMHVHITMSPDFEQLDYYLSPKSIVELSYTNLNSLKKIGVTTCRDMGSYMHSTEWVKLALKKENQLPRVITCGDIITYPSGHMCECGLQINNLSDIDFSIANNVDVGAEFIKVTSDPKDIEAVNRYPNPAFNLEYLWHIVEKSNKHNLSVACHTYPSHDGVYRALKAGVRTIEHAVPFNDLMGKLYFPNTFYVPTFATSIDVCGLDFLRGSSIVKNSSLLRTIESIMSNSHSYGGPIPESILEWYNILISNLPSAIFSNQLLCTGSDAGCKGTDFSTLLREILFMCLLGATNLQALQFAITNPCKALKLNHIGKIAVGNIANIILLKENPLNNINTLLDNVNVICNGKHNNS